MRVGLFMWGLAAGACGYAVLMLALSRFGRAVPPGTLRPDFADKARALRRRAGLGWLSVGLLCGAAASALNAPFVDWVATGMTLTFLAFATWWTTWLVRRANS